MNLFQFTAPSPAEAEEWVDQIQFLLKGEFGGPGSIFPPSLGCSLQQCVGLGPCWGSASRLSQGEVLGLCCLGSVVTQRWSRLFGAHIWPHLESFWLVLEARVAWSLPPDLSSFTIPCDEEDEEELYNDVDSSGSVTTVSHNTTLNQDGPNVEMEEDDIYEVLPGKQPNPEPSPSLAPSNALGYTTHRWE